MPWERNSDHGEVDLFANLFVPTHRPVMAMISGDIGIGIIKTDWSVPEARWRVLAKLSGPDGMSLVTEGRLANTPPSVL
jgi:hypothetical protein